MIGTPPSAAIRGPKVRILYIDDDESVARSVERLLERMGHSVVGLRNPREAIDRFLATPDQWDVVITDFRMPELDGLAVARAVLAARPGHPMVLLSGYAEVNDVETARAIGLQVVLPKPASLEELAHGIRRALQSRPSPS